MKNIVEKIRDAGVVGAGGAGFPTHAKAGAGNPEYVIANGAECEPLLRGDRQIMERYAPAIVEGLRLVMDCTGARGGVIALKDHYGGAIEALSGAAGKSGITLHIMKSYYPAGDEQHLVYDITGRVVPTGGIPLDAGALVSNVGTLLNVKEAGRKL